MWKGSGFCSGTGSAARESSSVGCLSSVAWGGQRDVQHGAGPCPRVLGANLTFLPFQKLRDKAVVL